jgi:hypothetical protein
MKRQDLLGRRMAYRERVRGLGEPLRPVEVVDLGRSRTNRVCVRWLDGDGAGAETWVPAVGLVARWQEADGLLADEQHLLAALAAS